VKIVISGRYNVYGRRAFKIRLKYESVYIEYNTKKLKHLRHCLIFHWEGGSDTTFSSSWIHHLNLLN